MSIFINHSASAVSAAFRLAVIALAIYGGLDLSRSVLAQEDRRAYVPYTQQPGTLDSRVAALEHKLANVVASSDAITVTGANLYVLNGTGTTDGEPNGLGNLTVGYNNVTEFTRIVERSGSHMLVVGDDNNYIGYGGLVVGKGNSTGGAYASIVGGIGNVTGGDLSAIVGGVQNQARGEASTIVGSQAAQSFGRHSTAVGGYGSLARGDGSSVVGGESNQAEGERSALFGGGSNLAQGARATVLGGRHNVAYGTDSTVTGGEGNTASGEWSSVSGGQNRTAPGDYNWVAGSLLEER